MVGRGDVVPNRAPVITTAYPQLFVADITAACVFFERKLGFGTVFKYGTPPFYGQVMRDGARLNLRCVDRPIFDRDLREREQLLSAYVPVEGVDALYGEYVSNGVDFRQPLKRQPWGIEEFVVRDPDGNLICFGSA